LFQFAGLRVDFRLLLLLGRFGEEFLLQLGGQDQFEDEEVAGLVVEVDAGVFGRARGLLVGREQRVLESVHQLVGGDSLLLLERFDCVDDLFAHWGDSLVSEAVLLARLRRYLSPGEETSSAYSARRWFRWWVTRSQSARSTPSGWSM